MGMMSQMYYLPYFGTPEKKAETVEKFKKFKALCDRLDCTQAQFCIAWCCKLKAASCSLFGASSIEQLENNLKCIEVMEKITPEIESEINEIWQTKPKQELDYQTWTPMPDRR